MPQTPDFASIYRSRAGDYEQLVAHEDYLGNIRPALAQIRELAGLEVVELGAGTGRLTRLLLPDVKQIIALDISPHMLDEARVQLDRLEDNRWHLAAADNRMLPLPQLCAELVVAGWSFGHFTGWHPDTWRSQIDLALTEMKRVLRPGGTIIILETLGTGRESPQPPTPALAAYYAWLQDDLGFSHAWIRTDYHFPSPAKAAELVRFFFGEQLAQFIEQNQMTKLPECTGIWWLTL